MSLSMECLIGNVALIDISWQNNVIVNYSFKLMSLKYTHTQPKKVLFILSDFICSTVTIRGIIEELSIVS